MSPSTGWPDDLYAELGDRAGRACFRLLLLEELWVHRRVGAVGGPSPPPTPPPVSVGLPVPPRLPPLPPPPGRQCRLPFALPPPAPPSAFAPPARRAGAPP